MKILHVVILLLALTVSIQAQVTYRTSAAGGATNGSGDRTVTITPAVGDLLVVFVIASSNSNHASWTMTDNNGSGTYARINGALTNSSADSIAVFVRNAKMVNTTSTVITAVTGSNSSGSLVVVAVSGMSRVGAAAVRQSAVQANQSGGGTPAPAFSGNALTANMTLGAVGNATNPATMTTPTNWTERHDVGQATPSIGLEVVTRDSGFTNSTITWGSTSASAFASIIVELDASAEPLRPSGFFLLF